MIVPNHLWATWSVWLCLYLQRLCPLLYYFFLSMCSGRFLAPATWQCVCSPQPITVKVWELDQLPGCKLLISLGGRGGRAYLDSCIYKPQPKNPTCFAFGFMETFWFQILNFNWRMKESWDWDFWPTVWAGDWSFCSTLHALLLWADRCSHFYIS